MIMEEISGEENTDMSSLNIWNESADNGGDGGEVYTSPSPDLILECSDDIYVFPLLFCFLFMPRAFKDNLPSTYIFL